MSQSDTDFENETKAFMDVVMSNLPASQNRIELIKTESAKDEICRNYAFVSFSKSVSDCDIFSTGALDSVSAMLRSFPATCDILKSNLIRRILKRFTKDEICRNLISYCRDGWPEKSKLDEKLRPYWTMQGEFTVHDNLPFKGTRIVIPKSEATFCHGRFGNSVGKSGSA
jgi:hypothetical protein